MQESFSPAGAHCNPLYITTRKEMTIKLPFLPNPDFISDGLCGSYEYWNAETVLALMRTASNATLEQLAEEAPDTARIDWLETMINKYGEIHLHNGNYPHGLGLGLQVGSLVRTLREAIDLSSREE